MCLGFFVAGDEGNAEAQSLFICERKAFDNLCTGLTQPCQCPSHVRKIIKTIQVCIANSDELAKFELVFMRAPQKGHVLRVEFQCQQLVSRFFLDRVIQPSLAHIPSQTDSFWLHNLQNENESRRYGLGMLFL